MKRMYTVLCSLSAALTLAVAVAIPFWGTAAYGYLLFCAAFALCTGIMRLLLTLRERTEGTLRRVVRILYGIGTALFSLFLGSFVVVQGILLVNAHTDPEARQADYLLVLGGGIRGDQPGCSLTARLEAARACWEQNPSCTLIVCGGQGADEQYTEAYVMHKWLLAHGVPKNRILLEDQSVNTVQNIRNAKEILRQTGAERARVAVVSSGFHLFRARHLMEQAGLGRLAVAAPSPWYLRPLFCLREYFSLAILVATGRW